MIIECKCFFQVRSCLKHLFLFYTICWCVVWFFLNIGIWASLLLAPFAFEHTISAIFTFSNRHCIGCNQSKCTACGARYAVYTKERHTTAAIRELYKAIHFIRWEGKIDRLYFQMFIYFDYIYGVWIACIAATYISAIQILMRARFVH